MLFDKSIADGDQKFTYDWSNRLVKTEAYASGVWSTQGEYQYDALNRRVSKQVGTSLTLFAYDGPRVAYELDGTTAASATLTRSYAYNSYIDSPLMMIDEDSSGAGGSGVPAGYKYYYFQDRRFSVVALAATSTTGVGVVGERYRYTAFGEMTVHQASGGWLPSTSTVSLFQNPYGFTGRRYDAETAPSTGASTGQGLWHYRNRMYSSTLGRFLQRDPAGYIDGYNLYAYVRNNPARLVDPRGLEYVDVVNGKAYWVVEQDGWTYNKDVDRVLVGSVSGSYSRRGRDTRTVTLNDGRTVAMTDLKTQASRFWNDYGDQSGSSAYLQNYTRTGAINRVATGDVIQTKSARARLLSAGGSGAVDGLAVEVSTFTLGGVWSERADRAQALAIQRGDTLAQYGFAIGKNGARGLQVAGIATGVGLVAPAAVAGSTALIGPTATTALVQTGTIAGTSYAFYGAGSSLNNAYQQGWSTPEGIESLGDALLYTTVAGAGTRPSLQALGQAAGGVTATAEGIGLGLSRFGQRFVHTGTAGPTPLNARGVQADLLNSALGRPVSASATAQQSVGVFRAPGSQPFVSSSATGSNATPSFSNTIGARFLSAGTRPTNQGLFELGNAAGGGFLETGLPPSGPTLFNTPAGRSGNILGNAFTAVRPFLPALGVAGGSIANQAFNVNPQRKK